MQKYTSLFGQGKQKYLVSSHYPLGHLYIGKEHPELGLKASLRKGMCVHITLTEERDWCVFVCVLCPHIYCILISTILILLVKWGHFTGFHKC